MANPNKFTAKEVLNKVLLDSSGNAVTANSVTSQEALNSVLDTTNNRLNMSLAGGTISGDVTISGDLTVSGGGSLSFDEILEGTQVIDVTNTEAFLVRKNSNGGDVFVVDTTNVKVGIGGQADSYLYLDGLSGNTYFHYNHNDMIDVYTGGDIAMRIKDDDVEFNGAIVPKSGITGNATNFDIHQTSDDASDNRRTRIGGGGDVSQTRGAYIELAGNEHSNTGQLILNAGDVTGGDIIFKTDNTTRLTVDNNSRISLTNNDAGGTGGSDGTSANTIFGYLAGEDIVDTGVDNTYFGHKAGSNNATGDDNTFVGSNAGKGSHGNSHTSNVGVGSDALLAVSTGSYNAVMGNAAAKAMTDGHNNIAIGNQALMTSTSAGICVAIGDDAMKNGNVTSAADGAVAIGGSALLALTSGAGNTAVGNQAGATINTGGQNTMIGAYAGDATDDGAQNTALGYLALSANCGDANTAIGRACLSQATGGANTAMGQSAGGAVTSGSNNLLLGQDAGLAGSPGGAITTGSNEIVLGDENISEAHVQVDWTIASDARDKTDFKALDLGLDFVNALSPVTYKWDKRSKYGDKTDKDYDLLEQTPDGTHKEDWLDIGFKAQDVVALEMEAGYNKSSKTNLVSSHSEDGKQMGLKYSKFVPILVKAIQEQSNLIEELRNRISVLEKK